jgi:hypothetical protein
MKNPVKRHKIYISPSKTTTTPNPQTYLVAILQISAATIPIKTPPSATSTNDPVNTVYDTAFNFAVPTNIILLKIWNKA